MPPWPGAGGGGEDTTGAGDGLIGSAAMGGGCSGNSMGGGTGPTGDMLACKGVDVLGCI